MQELRTAAIDVVCLGERQEGLPSMAIDNVAAGRRAADYLVGLGHRRIGLLGAGAIDDTGSPVLRDRRSGFEAALREAGLEADRAHQPALPLTIQGGAAAIDELAALDDPPPALFALSDETAMGAMGRAREIGIHVPGDISIMGFDGHELSESFGLTTLSQRVEDLGARMATWMLDILGDDDTAASSTDHVEVPIELIRRSSCARPRPEIH